MKLILALSILLCFATISMAQEQNHSISTIFGNGSPRASGGYGAITNKFSTINGDFANIVELYGGWYINHRFLLGISGAAVTNNLSVDPQYSALPGTAMSYGYGQAGLMTEYVFHSDKAIHVAFQFFGGAGFTFQYDRNVLYDEFHDTPAHGIYDEDCFFVAEPGVKIEMNIFRWMRFSPGVSYRAAFNSKGRGLSDDALSAISYNATLKFGKF